MKNILAENLLRFGAKGINEKMMKPYLLEQKTMPLDQIKKLVDADTNNTNQLNISQKQGNCVFIKSPVYTTTELDLKNIRAQFYNNMVSLQQGLMPETPLSSVQSQIETIINEIKETNLKNLEIEIIGTATSQPASDKPDTELLKINPNAQLDHPDGAYGGAKPNNEYLAQQRANSIKTIFEKLLPTAKFTTSFQVIPGGSRDDAKRYVQVKTKGDTIIKDTKIFNDIYLNWKVTYTTGEASSNEQGIKKADTQGLGSAYTVPTNPVPAYQASILIEFGQINAPKFSGTFSALSLDGLTNLDQQTQSWLLRFPNKMTNSRYKWIHKVPTKTTSTGPFLGNFLQSCGYLTRDLANSLDNYEQGSMLDITGTIFKKLAEKGSGNLQDFMSIIGGNSEQQIKPEFAFNASIYDVTVTPPTLTKIK